MRIFSLPIAMALALCLYLPFPRAAQLLFARIASLYQRFLRLFTRKDGRTDEPLAFVFFLLIAGGVFQVIGGLHVLLAGVLLAPLFCAFALFPQASKVKDQLDSGVFARDPAAYDECVRSTCATLAPAFLNDLFTPLLLCALGMPLHLGCALGGAYLAARALGEQSPGARRLIPLLTRGAWLVMKPMMLLCSCVVGRNPLRIHGENARELMLSALGIAGEADDTHIPVSGDIAQAILLGMTCVLLFLFAICLVLLSFC